jgi:MFS family permease
MWRLGFFFHEMGFGLLSIFLPLHMVALGGSLVDIGIMSATALLVAIPASFFWGYMCDKMRRYKRFVLLSFLTSAIILYILTLTNSVSLLIALYALMSVLHVAHEAPKNVLIAESYSRQDWEKSFAQYEGFTEAGWLIGLVLGFLASAYGLSSSALLICSVLNLAGFGLSLVLVADPMLVFERSLVSIEKSTDFAYHGAFLASRILGGERANGLLKRENLTAFCVGLVLFSLATSILFTPMPIFVSDVVKAASLPASFVFAIFVLNSGGGVVGYFLAGNHSKQGAKSPKIGRIVIFRSLLSLLLVAVWSFSAYTVPMVTAILILLGFANAIFLVYALSLSMELIPAGKAGLFNVLIGIGGACGSFVGPFIAQTFGFFYVFMIASLIFFVAYVAFEIFA